jgi:glycosyltransferase involved in cell wall biosynthesis
MFEMTKTMKLSVCTLALNEENHLEQALESVKKIADEIIVVIDDRTTDSSETIARRFTDKVYIKKHKDNFHFNKQWAIDKAKGEWVFWLDSDEYLSDELIEEIRKIVNSRHSELDSESPSHNGYLVPRQNYIFGKWIAYTGWYPDYQLRLFKNGMAKYPCKKIHENPKLDGKAGHLHSNLIHHNYDNVSQFIEKLNRYTSLDSKNLSEEIGKVKPSDFVARPVDEFIKRFLAWQGYKDGLHGFVLSILQAFYQFVVVVKVWEMNGFSEQNVEFKQLKSELKEGMKKLKWWSSEIKIKESKRVKKLWLKVKRKVNLN